MSQSESDNLDEIAESIFSKPPGPPNSVQLQLEEVTADIAEKEGVEEFIFNILYLITFKGIKKLYGYTSVQELTEPQFQNIQKYVNSYGYIITLEANNTNKTPWEIFREGGRLLNYRIGFEKLY